MVTSVELLQQMLGRTPEVKPVTKTAAMALGQILGRAKNAIGGAMKPKASVPHVGPEAAPKVPGDEFAGQDAIKTEKLGNPAMTASPAPKPIGAENELSPVEAGGIGLAGGVGLGAAGMTGVEALTNKQKPAPGIADMTLGDVGNKAKEMGGQAVDAAKGLGGQAMDAVHGAGDWMKNYIHSFKGGPANWGGAQWGGIAAGAGALGLLAAVLMHHRSRRDEE